ncbi:small ribosomal subunit biogenesis GTPase RsgA 1, mitochondrial isoform X1 [Brassica napus]|uniref:small ribosomal subunit biogenesis GTPase RsgA 1, mitochondrial isoform X1 n=1 Tax=Brassica napus TaxID=3708 RepID=UPI0020799AB6|nr:small ribosomal subunit biogenesis GTPase RsgA 1, mitochondrial isoform X1 [Brassica napus]
MQISSLSIIRHSSPFLLRRASIHHGGCGVRLGTGIGIRRSFHLLTLSARRDNPDVSRKPQPSKNMLRAKHIGKHHSSLAPVLSPDHNPSLLPSQAIGTVATAQANFMRVVVQDGDGDGDDRSSSTSSSKDGVELLCVVRAVLKKIRRRVLVGDKVLVGSIDWVDRRGMIENVFQRRSEILDPPVANVDHLLVLFSLDQPKLEPFTLTRFLVEAESTGIPLTLALNKCELITEEELESWKMRLRGWNYEPFFCSVGTKEGLDAIAFVLRNQTSVIVGPSGVGKSSLINILRSSSGGGDVEDENWFEPIIGNKWFEDQRVGEVSTRSGRGKHTTRNVSLLPITEGGYLADTPGFNQPSLLKVTKHSLALCFPEIRKMIEEEKCGFKDCLHIGEPGCVVKGGWERYPYYLQLLDEIRVREEFQLRTFGTKREGDVRYKVGGMGVKQAEPRLQPKKHRRESRKKVKQTMISELDEYEDEESDLDIEDDPIVQAIENEKER